MGSIIKHMLRNCAERKFRTIIIIAAILLSTMVTFIGLSVNKILNDTYTTMVQGAYGKANIVVSKNQNVDNPYYKYEDLDVSGSQVKQQANMTQATGKSRINGEKSHVTLSGMSYHEASEMKLFSPIKQRKHFKLEGDSIVISQRTATDCHLSLGDKIEVTVNNDKIHYRIGAIAETNGIFYAELGKILLVVPQKQLSEAVGGKNLLSQTFLKVSKANVDDIQTRLSEHNPSFSIQNVHARSSNEWDNETFLAAMTMAIIIIVLISAYVISSLAKVIILERMPVVGTFRSIGTSRRTMNRILTIEFLFYGVAGALLGIGLACLLLPVVAEYFNEYKEFGVKTMVDYHVSYVAIALVFGICFPVGVSMLHIFAASRKPLKEIMLNTTQTMQKRSHIPDIIGLILLIISFVVYLLNASERLIPGLIALALFFISVVLLMQPLLNMIVKITVKATSRVSQGEMKLGFKNVANNKLVANNTSMIVVVILLLLMVGITSAGLEDYINHTIKRDSDVMVGNLTKDPFAYENLKKIDGVSDLSKQYISTAQYDMNGNRGDFGVIGVDDLEKFDAFYSGVTFQKDAKANMVNLDNGVIIDEYQAKKYHLAVGDTFQLQPMNEQGEVSHEKADNVDVIVAGFMDSGSFTSSKSSVMVHLDLFKRHFGSAFNEIALKVNQAHDANQVKKKITDIYADDNLDVQTFDEMLSSQKATIDTLLMGIKVIIFMGLIVGLLGITNNLLVSFGQRKKEFAVLYSVCMSKWQIISMLLFEMVMMYAAIIIISFASGHLLNMVLSKLLRAIGLVIPFHFDWALFGILCVVVFVLLVLSTLSIVRKVFTMNILDELRYE